MRLSDSDSTGSDEGSDDSATRLQNVRELPGRREAGRGASRERLTLKVVDAPGVMSSAAAADNPLAAPQPPPGAGAGAGAADDAPRQPPSEEGCCEMACWPNAGFDDERDERFLHGQRVPKGGGGKNYQHILPAVLPVLGVQHLLAVVGSVIVNARAIGNDGTCSAGSECDVAIKSSNESAAAIEACHTEGCYMASDSEFYEHVVVWTVFISGLCTMLQSGPLGPLSSNLLSIMGTSSAFIGTIANTGHRAPPGQGVALVMLMNLLTFWIEPVIMYTLPESWIKDNKMLFDPTVKASVVITIGLTLTSRVGVKMWVGDGSAEDCLVGFFCVFMMMAISKSKLGFMVKGAEGADGVPIKLKSASLLISVVLGWLLHNLLKTCGSGGTAKSCEGGVGLSDVASGYGNLVSPATFPGFIPTEADGSLIDATVIMSLWVPWAMTRIASMLESIGDITATAKASGKVIDGPHFERRLRGGLNMDGLSGFIGAICGAFPLTTMSQNNGLIRMSGLHDYRGGLVAGGLMMMLAPFAAHFNPPMPAMGGCLTVIFATIAMGGVSMLADVTSGMSDEERTKYRNGEKVALKMPLDSPRTLFIVATSVGLGLGAELHKYGLNSFGHKVGQVFPFKHLDVSSACVEARTLACADLDNVQHWVAESVAILFESGIATAAAMALLLNWLWPKDDKPFIALLDDLFSDERISPPDAIVEASRAMVQQVPVGAAEGGDSPPAGSGGAESEGEQAAVAAASEPRLETLVGACIDVNEWLVTNGGAAEASATILEILRGLALAGFGVGEWLPVLQSMSDDELQGLISAARAQHAHHPPPPSPHKLRAESPKHVNVEIEEAGEDGVIAHV